MQSNSQSGEQQGPPIASQGSNLSSGTINPQTFYRHTSYKPVTPPRPKNDAPKMGSAPISNHRAKSSDLNAIPKDLETRVIGLHAEILGRIVGPFHPLSFINILPKVESQDTEEAVGKAAADGKAAAQLLAEQLNNAKVEIDMYRPLVEYFTTLCPSRIQFRDEHNTVVQVFDGQKIKPDILVYKSNDSDSPNKPKKIEAMFEVKFNDADDPFNDDLPGFVTETDRGAETLGQITSYATCHQAMEFRTHIFSALIFPKYMRLLRWDRSGVIVTKKTPFNSPFLFEFFRRFSAANSAERGRDPTVRKAKFATPADETKIRLALGCQSSKSSLLTISIGDRKYIISKDQPPGSTSPVGRSTRCFKAYGMEEKILVLLKDSWRVDSPTLKPEHKIYRRLHEAKVQNIPEFYHGADIGGDNDPHHITQTQVCLDKLEKQLEKRLGVTLRTFRHYRIALEYLEYKLEEFQLVWELIAVVRDAGIAHGQAAKLAQVLHRDISNGNIMFKRDNGGVRGYLIDWDLSLDLTLARNESAQAQPERTGTWQFLAVRLLQEPEDGEPLIQNRIDDVESFFHLLTWMALRYTAHSLDSRDLTLSLHRTFDSSYRTPSTGASYVTSDRQLNIMHRTLIIQANLANPAIVRILQGLQEVLGQRYAVIEEPEKIHIPGALDYARSFQAKAFEFLEDSDWLPNLLTEYLENKNIDWETEEDRVVHVLEKPTKFVRSNHKRKTESSLHSGGSMKASRTSHAATPQDNRADHD